MPEKTFKLHAIVSSANLSVIKPVLEQAICKNGSVKPSGNGFEVVAEFKGERARDLNRTLLSELRRVEKKTSIRSVWTSEGETEKFFDYALKGTKKTNEK
jgi:hypothetical protein